MSQSLHRLKEASLMTEIEQHEMNEAAMSLVMLSEQVYDFDLPLGDDDDSMDLDQLKPMEEKILDCVESNTCSDVVAQALLSPLKSKLQKTLKIRSSYKCNICGRSFVCSQGLGSHKRLHKLIREKLVVKRKYTEDKNSLSDSLEAKKIVLQPSSFEVSQEKSLQLHCVESKQDFSELFSYSGSDKSCSFSGSTTTLSSKLQKETQSKSRYDCNVCGKSFVYSQGLGSHKRHHRTIDEKLSRKRKSTGDCDLLSHSIEAKKIDAQSLSFEVSQEKILHCVESKQDFSELLLHSGFDKCSSFSESPSTLSKLQNKTQSKSSYICNICGKSFVRSQALDSHQRKCTKDCNSLSDSTEAKKIVLQPSRFEVYQEKILHCVESKQDFSELFSYSSFDTELKLICSV